MLGTIELSHLRTLLDAVVKKDGKALLEVVAELDGQAPDYELVLADMAAFLQRLALVQAVPEAGAEYSDATDLRALAQQLSAEDVQLYYQIALLGKRDLPLAPSPRGGFEMTLLRMLAFAPHAPSGDKAANPRAARAADGPAGRAAKSADMPAMETVAAARKSAQAWQEPDWMGLVECLDLKGAARQLALNCAYRRREGNVLHLELDAAHEHMATDQLVNRMQESLSRYYGEALKVRIQPVSGNLETPAKRDERRQAEHLKAAQEAIVADPNVRNLCETFGTQVNPELVKPAD